MILHPSLFLCIENGLLLGILLKYTLLPAEVRCQIPCLLVCTILSNFSAKEKSGRFKATKWSKGNRNGGQGRDPLLACMEALPKIGQVFRIQSSERGWESRRCFRRWGEHPPSSWLTQHCSRAHGLGISSHFSPQPGAFVGYTDCTARCSGFGKKTQPQQVHLGTGPEETTFIIKQKRKRPLGLLTFLVFTRRCIHAPRKLPLFSLSVNQMSSTL